jgi:hypothetical protein
VNTQEYIESGMLEAYVTGSASDKEVKELLYMQQQYPEVRNALQELEADMERVAQHMAVMPPPGTWERIEGSIDDLIRTGTETVRFKQSPDNGATEDRKTAGPEYIEVEEQSSHMRVHKAWKWVFAAVFVLGKIFLAFAIYFYLENRQAQQQLQELKTEIKQLKTP